MISHSQFLKNCFIFCSEIHNYDIVSSSADKFFQPSSRIQSYGKNYIIKNPINCCNKVQNMLGYHSLQSAYRSTNKNILTQRCIKK